ncbi:MAG: DUF488 domain-containing protein [Magnetococcales bacterium]|nr:DUF488 domain-containing protein [Magnetococcales bacterium]
MELCTIGYEGAELNDFLNTLETKGVECLIDIREVPLSRRKGFSKKVLAAVLSDRNIQYIHLPALGDPKEGREAARQGRMDTFRQIFSGHMTTPSAIKGLEEVSALAMNAKSCLLCYERDPEMCHRSIVARSLHAQHGFIIRNLGVNVRKTR